MIQLGLRMWGKIHRDDVQFSVHCIGGYVITTWLTTANVNLGHVVQVVSARSLHGSATFFPLQTLLEASHQVLGTGF